MIVLRLAGAVLLTLSGAFAARMINASISMALAQTEGIISFIRFFRKIKIPKYRDRKNERVRTKILD